MMLEAMWIGTHHPQATTDPVNQESEPVDFRQWTLIGIPQGSSRNHLSGPWASKIETRSLIEEKGSIEEFKIRVKRTREEESCWKEPNKEGGVWMVRKKWSFFVVLNSLSSRISLC